VTAKRKDITRDLLQELYIHKNLSVYKMAPILHCHPATLSKKLHKYHISIKHPVKKINLAKNELKELYFTKKLSTYKIAKLLNCSVKTISNKMRKYNFKGRPVSKPPIDEEILLNEYSNKRLSLKEIGIRHNLTASGVLKRMRKFNIPTRDSWETNTGIKIPFKGTLEEKAYMTGFRLGDLGVRQSSKKTKMITVGSNTTKNEQVVLIKNLFKKYSKVWVSKPNLIGVINISTILHPSFSFLLPKNDNIEKWIRANDKTMRAFTAGYIDAEGSFGIYNKRAKFRLGSYDKNILKQISVWLKNHRMKTIFVLERKKKLGQNKDFWRITINDAKSLLILHELIFPYMKHKKRKMDLKAAKQNVVSRLRSGTIRI